MIEEGYCNDALNLVSQLSSEDVKFRYLNALACIRASNKELAFSELDKCLQIDPHNIECYILKGKLLWSVDRVDEGNACFWQAHQINPNHNEVIEFLSIQKPRADEFYKRATTAIYEGKRAEAFELIEKGLELFHDMAKLLLLRASLHRESADFD